jgi:hypothetical protein
LKRFPAPTEHPYAEGEEAKLMGLAGREDWAAADGKTDVDPETAEEIISRRA